MSRLAEALVPLVEAIERQGHPWYLFGAHAVALLGSPRATADIDITLSIAHNELQLLLKGLAEHGFRPRYPDLAAELLRHSAVAPLLHEPTGFEVDLVVAGAGLEALALSRTRAGVLDGVPVRVVSPTDLVVMKIVAGRGKDLADARSVLARGEVDLNEARDLLEQFEQALARSDLLPALAQGAQGVVTQ